MTYIPAFIKYAVLTVIVVGILCISSEITSLKGSENRDYSAYAAHKGFYEEEKNTIDMLFLGSSASYCGLNSQYASDNGINTWNLASSQQSLLTSYWWLREALRTQKPDTVCLETFYCFYNVGNEGSLHKAFDTMKMSPVKLSAIMDLCRNFTRYRPSDFVFPVLRFHNRVFELEKEDIAPYELTARQKEYRGYCQRDERSGKSYVSIEQSDVEGAYSKKPKNECKFAEKADQELDEFSIGYLDRIRQLCDENGIRLILVKTPTVEWTPAQHGAIESYAEENGLTFIDYNMSDEYAGLGYDFAADNADSIHANRTGAEKITKDLIEKLRIISND